LLHTETAPRWLACCTHHMLHARALRRQRLWLPPSSVAVGAPNLACWPLLNMFSCSPPFQIFLHPQEVPRRQRLRLLSLSCLAESPNPAPIPANTSCSPPFPYVTSGGAKKAEAEAAPVKRGRGRPRKEPKPEPEEEEGEDEQEEEAAPPPAKRVSGFFVCYLHVLWYQ
jgi:hypothetical protein